jgi:hypothetical protein
MRFAFAVTDSSWDRLKKNIFAEKNCKKFGVFDKKAKLCKFLIITFDFEKNAIFSPKIGKNRRK